MGHPAERVSTKSSCRGWAAYCCLLLAHCAAPPSAAVEGHPKPPNDAAAIVGGSRVTGSHPAVVLILVDEPVDRDAPEAPRWRASCTGTLIAPDVVLTAAHCLSPGPSATSASYLEGGKTIGILLGDDLRRQAATADRPQRLAQRTVVHPLWRPGGVCSAPRDDQEAEACNNGRPLIAMACGDHADSLDDFARCVLQLPDSLLQLILPIAGSNSYDVGLIQLQEPLETTAPVARWSPAHPLDVQPGCAGEAIGYGVTRWSHKKLPGAFPQLTEAEPSEPTDPARLPDYGLKHAGEAVVRTLADSELDIDGAPPGGAPRICFGDSGGPLLIDDAAGTPLLVGVASRIDPQQGRSIYTRVDVLEDWLHDTLQAWAAEASLAGGTALLTLRP